MKRNIYVDSQGNSVNEKFESKKIILKLLFFVGTIVPVILVGFISYTAYDNNRCYKIYNFMKSASIKYLKDEDKLPDIEGEDAKRQY